MRFIVVLLLLISINGFGQWKSFILNPKGDTLNRVDMKGKKQGPWAISIADLRGERGYDEEGYFENDMKEGVWKKFSLEGVKIAEESWRAIDPAQSFDTVAVYDLKDPSKILNRVIVKNEGVAMKHGKWTYYDPREGTIEATESYIMNKLQTDGGDMIADDDIRPIEVSTGKVKIDTVSNKKTTKPQAVLDYEKKNSGKKKIKARDGETGYKPEP
jgi:hypothetical protein